MKFDTIIIGGGLSGLTCGIRLQQAGQKCVIISSGQSALHFSSGSFDLLNQLPNGEIVHNPQEAVKSLITENPKHPYSKLGIEKFSQLTSSTHDFLKDIGLQTKGSDKKNHFRITPMGILKPTWLSMDNFATSEIENQLAWKKVAIFSITGFLDFYPKFIADELKKLGTESKIQIFNLPELEHLRKNPSELRSTNIARVLDKSETRDSLIKILKEGSKDCEAIIFPACIGLDDYNVTSALSKAVGKPIHLIPTLPPSATGVYTQQYLHNHFIKSGGVYMLGDSIQRADIENNKITKVYSYNHGDIPFRGKNVVLATGSYFSQGLIATSNRVYEPIFDLDIDYLENREEWYNINMFENQNYQQFGVKTNDSFNGLKNGKPIENLYVAGAILEGFNPVKEGSGAGVSILTALDIANTISLKHETL